MVDQKGHSVTMKLLAALVLLGSLHDVVGNVPPRIDCPKSSTIVIPKNQKKVAIKWDQLEITAIDQEDGTLIPTLDRNSPRIGDMLGEGTYTIAYRATDQGGRSSQCMFSITVKGANCPALISGQYGVSSCRQGAIYGQVCTVDCNDGYAVLGENGVECQANGSYSGILPKCARVTSYQQICSNIATSPSNTFMHDVDVNFGILKNKLIAMGALNSYKTMERAKLLCNDTKNSNHGSCVFLRRFNLFELFKRDSAYNDLMYRRLLLLHPEVANFCKNTVFVDKLYDTFPDIERINDVQYQNDFKKTMTGLANTTSNQLRTQALVACDPKASGSQCLLKDVFDLIDRSLVFISLENKVAHWEDVHIKRFFNALTFSSVLLKWNYLDVVKAVRPVTIPSQQEVLSSILSALSAYVDNGDDDKIRIVTSMFPEVITDKICNEGKMCLFWRVIDQTRVYLKSRQPSTFDGVKVRVIDSTLDKRDFLGQKQMERLLNLMASQQYSLITVAQDLKSEFNKGLNDRFSELKTYFQKIQSFNALKAQSDLGIIKDIKDLSNTASSTAQSVDSDMSKILGSMMTIASAEAVGKGVKLALTIAENCNPLKAILDSSPSSIYDASAELGHALAGVAKAGSLIASLHTLTTQALHISRGFAANDKFFSHMTTLMKSVTASSKTEGFEESKDAFLDAYGRFSPAIKKSQLTEMGSYFTNVIEQACGLIEGTSALESAIPKGIIGGTGICWKTKINIDKMMTMYESIYDKQFELVEVLVSNVQAQVALDAADGIVTDYNKVAKDPSKGDDVLQKLQQVAGMSYVSYRLMVIQVIRLYCDELEYQNGGNRPSVCKDTGTDVSLLLSYNLPDCTRKLEFQSVPGRKRGNKDTAYMDLTKLYAGDEINFKIQNSKWLYDNGWITRADKDSVIYVSGMEVYLPSEATNRRDVRVEVIVDGQNELKPGGTRYTIVPRKPMVYSYRLGQGISCRQGHPFDNPYNTCPTNKIADICPQSKDPCFLEAPQQRALHPSVFSNFRIRVSGYQGMAVPNESTRLNLRIGISTCTYVPPLSRGSYAHFFADQGRVRKPTTCCALGQYWSELNNACTNCPKNSTVALKGYYCNRS